ncbi:MAG: UDP-N-acetylmuramoyl-tripeptide--D-alanyl-D-alanine ligase [Bacteroidales bacterium]|jgi:UDP-N-acetylmuramoyl-tripeptide--D-alanyl-D-alanine ligase|nr:UDP-N-acetylmuramoyl-tripeptide--D-alanyl-D-alanine ligase [Bacteroidales bacterium]
MDKYKTSGISEIDYLYSLYRRNHKITTDSRNIENGDIFFALSGENFDGNKFAASALENGASCVVIDNPLYYNKEWSKEKCVLVEDSLKALQQLANLHRQNLTIPILGITGTNGKTTTKELILNVISRKYRTQATKGNLNNHIGVPLTLLSITDQTEFAIVEMGANHIGEIAALCEIAMPNYGLITNIGHAHIEGFGSFEGVIKTKCELLDYLKQHNGHAFINSDDPNIVSHADNLNTTTYSSALSADITAKTDPTKPYATLIFDNVSLNSNLVFAFNAQNILAAVCIGKYFGLTTAELQKAIAEYHPANHRSQIKKTSSNTLILDCYNANASSVNAVLKAFSAMTEPNKCVFLGAMKELGSESYDTHRKVAEFLTSQDFYKVALVGDEFKECCNQNPFLEWFSSSSELRNHLLSHPISNSTILIKGSRATRMEEIESVL